MTLRKTLLVVVMGMLLASLSALTLEDLENDVLGLYSPTVMAVTLEDGTEDFEVVPADADDMARADSIFATFLEEPRPARELEEAAGLWKDYNPDGYKAWIEARTSDPAAPLQVFYLWFKDQEDPLSRINAARQLITNYPAQVYGYRLMLLAYFDNFPIDYNFDDAEDVLAMWEADLPLMQKYYSSFPEDEYHRLAGILALNESGSNEEACDLLSEAYLEGDVWLDEIIPSRLQPIEQYHELLFTHFRMIMAHDDAWGKDEILSEIRAELVPFYFEDQIDYPKVIYILTADEEALDDYYNRFALVSSLYKTGDSELMYRYLVDKDNLAETVAFQDAWINYDPADARLVYSSALMDQDDMLARYLLSRVSTDRAQSIKDARAMLIDDSRGLYGYLLLADTYWNYFTNAAAEDPARADWLKWLKQDNGRLRAYFIRFPEDLKAQAAYMLTQIIGKNDERAFKYYQIILNRGPFSNEVKLTDTIIADTGNFKLLWDAKVAYIAKFIEQGYLEEADRAMYEVVGYCSALYSNGYFSKLTGEVYKNPNWLDYQDIQYMTVNSHYQLQEFGEVIDILRLMLDRGTTKGWFDSPEIVIEACIAGVALYLFLVHMFTAEKPFIPRPVFKDRNFISGLVLMFVMGLVLLASSALLSPYLQSLSGRTVTQTGLLMVPRGLGTMLAMTFAGRLTMKMDPRILMTIGAALLAWSLWDMTDWTPSIDTGTLSFVTFVQGLGMGLVFVPMNMVAFATLAPHFRTDGAGLTNLMRNIGSAIGVSLTSTILASSVQTIHSQLAGYASPFNRGLSVNAPSMMMNPQIPFGLANLNSLIEYRAMVQAYANDFLFMFFVILPVFGVIWLMKRPSFAGAAPKLEVVE